MQKDQLFDPLLPYLYTADMETQKITINVPVEALETAQKVTGKGITATVLAGLQELAKLEKRNALLALQGKVEFELDLEKTRK